MKKLFTLIAIVLIISSCRSPDRLTEKEPERSIFDLDLEIAEDFFLEDMDEFELFLYENRIRLSDRFAVLEHDMPETFLREAVSEVRDADDHSGFRVQILSTRNIEEADSTRDDFRGWATESIDGYDVEAYILFRQPYYRVRAGDFRDRDEAIEFSRLLKSRYPNAWVVHDRIELENVPSDTTDIDLIDVRRVELPDRKN